ncbi:MAG TPA: hypothetical protein VFM46_15620 [Pseudomonadales bacterium]|nr:hypothetical protein [Pseudomonadales bacterium]
MRVRGSLIAVLATFTALVCQAEPDVDVPGAKDSAIISRYFGSWLIAEEIKPFDETLLLSTYEFQNDQWVRPLRIEGAHTRIQYVAPAARSVLEVQRNYEAALQKAGAVKVLSCGPGEACETVLSSAVQPYVTWVMELPKTAADGQAYNAASAAQDKFHHALLN